MSADRDEARSESEYERREQAAYGEAAKDPKVRAVLDVLAPLRDWGSRSPVFEWGHETTPDAAEMITLAREIVAALELDT